MTWHMARAASKRTPRWDGKLSTKVVGDDCIVVDTEVCRDCGYMLCSCEPGRDYTVCEDCGSRCDDISDGRCSDCSAAEHRRMFEAQQDAAAEQPTLRDAICTLCGNMGADHRFIDGCPPVRCVFCQQTGVHDCPGGEYVQDRSDTAFSLAVTTGRMFPGSVDAEFTRGMRRI